MTPKNSETDRITERVVAQWDDVKIGKPRFLGNLKDTSFQMTMRLDMDSKPELLLWFHIVVRVKHHWHSHNPRSKTLFFVIQADMFDFDREQGCFTAQSVTDLCLPPPTICALSEANLGPLDAIYRLRFNLKTCGNMLMPRADTPFFPASDKAKELLQGLQSLSQAKDFCIYIPLKDKNFLSMGKKELPCDLATKQLCEMVAAKKMVTHEIDFESAYRDGAQWNAWKNFDLSTPCQNPRDQRKATDTSASVEAGPSTAPTGTAQEEQQTTSEQVVEQPFSAPPPGYDEATSTNGPDHTRPDAHTAAVSDAQNRRRAWVQLDLDLDGEETEDEEEVTEVPAPAVESRQHEAAVPAAAPAVANTAPADAPAAPATSAARPTEASPGTTAGADRQNKRKPRSSASEEDVEPSDIREETRGPRHRARKQVRFHDTAEQLPYWIRSHQRQHATASHTARSALRLPAPGSTPALLRKDLAEFIVWLMDVNVELEEVYEDVLWALGKAAGTGNEKEFRRIKAECKADVLIRYAGGIVRV